MAFLFSRSTIASCISSGLDLLCSRRSSTVRDRQVAPKAFINDEDKAKAEAEARLKAEEEARAQAEGEAKQKAEEEEAARQKAEEEAKQKAEEEAKAKADEEARLKAEEDARAAAEEEARLKAKEETRAKAEEEARLKAEEEARAKAEEDARLKAEEEERQMAREESALELPAAAEAEEPASEAPAAEPEAQEPVSQLPAAGMTDAPVGQLPASLAGALGSGGFTYLIEKDKALPPNPQEFSDSASPARGPCSPRPGMNVSESLESAHSPPGASVPEEPGSLGDVGDDCCLACGKSDGPLKRCSKCRSVRFCSVECQRRAWKAHKPDCARLARENGHQAQSPTKVPVTDISPPKAAACNLTNNIVVEDESRGAAFFHEGRYREALAAFQRMETTARAEGLKKEEGRALRLLGNAMDKMNAPSAEVEEVYKRSLRIAHQEDDMVLSFNVLLGMGSHATKTEDLDLAEHFYLQAQMLAQRVLSQEEESIAESNLAMCLAMSDSRRAESFSHFRKAISLGGSNKHSRAILHSNFASALSADGKVAEAQKEYTDALAVAREIGNQRVEMNVLMNLANLYETELKQHDEALDCRQKLAALSRAHAGSPEETPVCAICLDVLEVPGDQHKEVVVLQCRHAYHASCWKGCQQNGVGNECPLCRDPLAFHARGP
mmetsp:Transcript_158259/g.274895  ORF Transcript_158259/g.274895 Transcript_158259/m.274895 type:complete len:666 (-) Transcript_158259:89-2086(-)